MSARVKNVAAVAVLLLVAAVLLSCGNTIFCFFSSLNVSANGSTTADHTAIAPGNQVQFLAFGSGLTAGCVSTQASLTNVTWSVSDTQNVSISNAHDATYGTATCLHATNGPITVTATLSSAANSGTTATGTSTMTCK